MLQYSCVCCCVALVCLMKLNHLIEN